MESFKSDTNTGYPRGLWNNQGYRNMHTKNWKYSVKDFKKDKLFQSWFLYFDYGLFQNVVHSSDLKKNISNFVGYPVLYYLIIIHLLLTHVKLRISYTTYFILFAQCFFSYETRAWKLLKFIIISSLLVKLSFLIIYLASQYSTCLYPLH